MIKALMIGIVVAVTALPAISQTDPPAPPAPNPNQGLIDSKEKLAAQTELLKAEVELLKARIGTFPTGKDGAITVGTAAAYPIGAVERVYAQLESVAKQICTIVTGLPLEATESRVVLSPNAWIAATRYQVAERELAALEGEFKDIDPVPATAAAGFAAVGPILSAVESISKLFRTDRAITPVTTTIDSRHLQEAVYACLGAKKVYPAAQAEYRLLEPGSSRFFKRLSTLVELRPAIKRKHEAEVKAKSPNATVREASLARLDKLVAAIMTVPEGEKLPPLAEIFLGEAITESVKVGTPLIVSVEIAHQGGLSMIESRTFVSDRLYVGGGAIAAYRAVKKGELQASGVVNAIDPQLKRVKLGH